MTYVDAETFQSYIDEYNGTGSQEAKENALKHFALWNAYFTIKKSDKNDEIIYKQHNIGVVTEKGFS